MSKNHLNYSQPDSYHFSEDSLFLVELALRHLKAKPSSVLDIGAGCGVIGIEFALRTQEKIEQLHLVEPQSVFQEYLESNLKLISNIDSKNFQESIQNFSCGTYDLILSNPPYYDPKKGRPSSNLVQNKCRFSDDLPPSDLLESIHRLLNPEGEAWVIIGNGKEQNHALEEFRHPNLKSELFKEESWSILRFVKLNEK